MGRGIEVKDLKIEGKVDTTNIQSRQQRGGIRLLKQ